MDGWTKTELISLLAMLATLIVAIATVFTASWKGRRIAIEEAKTAAEHEASQDTRIELLEQQMTELTKKLDGHMKEQIQLMRDFIRTKK